MESDAHMTLRAWTINDEALKSLEQCIKELDECIKKTEEQLHQLESAMGDR
jgi:prefoldin subunit 5